MGAPRDDRGGGGSRRRWLRATVVALTLVALFVGQQSPASADDPLQQALRRKQDLERAVAIARANTERYQQAASQYQAAVNAATTRIADLAARAADAGSQADALADEILIAEEQLSLVAFQLDETKALVDALDAQVSQQTKLLAERQSLYARHLRTTYRQTMVSPLEMLLSSSSLTEFASRVQAMLLINRQELQLANEIRSLRESAAGKRDEATVKQQEIVGLQDQIKIQRERLAGEKAVYDELVLRTQASIDTQAAQRANAAANRSSAQNAAQQAARETAELNKRLEDAEAQYALLAAQLAGQSGLGVYVGGKLAIWPVVGTITSRFGPRWGGFHNGIDIAAPMFTPVRAPAAGRVVTVGRPYLAYGDTAVVVIIAHGNNLATLSGHLDDRRWPPVQVGQFVTAGTVIGYVGMTGWTTGPHDHFMTIVDGRAANPLSYLP